MKSAAVAEQVAASLAQASARPLPQDVVETLRKLMLDIAGLIIAARNEDYVRAALASGDHGGGCTALGHDRSLDAYTAALVNGTAAHGEDYDDTFEGGPVHSGAVIVPAVLAICERERLGGERLYKGMAAGVELLCRLSLVAPKAIHKAGFHPTAVIGAIAAAAGVSVALGLSRAQTVSALGIAGSMASGLIEYLAEGTWTKRMHAGWAAQSGIRAALMARAGFLGPRTVLEGPHGFFHGFAPGRPPDFDPLLDGLGENWLLTAIAFKPYACGTMTQPFIDCAIGLAEEGVAADDIADMLCEVGEGTVHRLWEPLAVKHNPQTPYAAKFSTPYCMALGFIHRKAGLSQFTQAEIANADVARLAGKIRYVVNPLDEYPRNFTGHLRATLKDGRVRELRQAHMRGGAHAPLTGAEIESKFMDNALYGGWPREKAERLRLFIEKLAARESVAAIREFGA
ncbi:MAG: MmgE/PrpD family protein [Parvibaculaceae bacterium]